MKKILLVEDEESIRQLLNDELREEGYEVFQAANGRDALAVLKEKEIQQDLPDLVILDIRMPGMDGLETMGHILKNRFSTPVIIHSAYSSYKDDVMALAADAYVVKSHDMTELKKTIHDLIGE